MIVQVGDGYPIRYRSVDSDRELIDATVALSVTDPSGNTTSPSISHPSTGIYEAVIDVDEAGIWQYTWTVSDPYDDVDKGQFTASSFVPPDYVSLALVKRNLNILTSDEDELVQFAITTACDQVNKHCYRRFWADPTTSTREYNPDGRTFQIERNGYVSEKILVDDIAVTTGMVVQVGYGDTWNTIPASEIDTWPDNALADFKPVEALIRRGSLWTTHPRQRLRVTTKHGYPANPQGVKHAALIQSTRYYLRKDSPEGVTGTAEWGAIRVARIDPDVQELLKDYVKQGAGSTG